MNYTQSLGPLVAAFNNGRWRIYAKRDPSRFIDLTDYEEHELELLFQGARKAALKAVIDDTTLVERIVERTLSAFGAALDRPVAPVAKPRARRRRDISGKPTVRRLRKR